MTDEVDLKPLNPRHKKVADQWLKTGNARQAAVNAGYSKDKAAGRGPQILRQPEVRHYLAVRAAELDSQEKTIQQRVHGELETLAFANIAAFITIDEDGLPQVDFSTATPEQLRAITSIKTKKRRIYDNRGNQVAEEQQSAFTMADKYRGLELLARVNGMLKPDEQRVVVDVADRLLAARQRLAAIEDQSGAE